MNKPLNVLAKELKSEIRKVHSMTVDLPEELFIKSQMVQNIKKHWCSRTGPTKYEDKFDYLVRQDWTQR